MYAYSATEWSNLFVASAGASAALTGLVFVAVSINIDRILSFPGLPERALATLLLLLGVTVMSIVGLIPGQSDTALGIEFLLVSITFFVTVSYLIHVSLGDAKGLARLVTRFLAMAPGVLFIVGSTSILLESGGGLYWIVGGIAAATVGAVMNAWVLLVEILR